MSQKLFGSKSTCSAKRNHMAPPAPSRRSHVYLFYNPSSGGSTAAVLARPELHQARLWLSKDWVVHLKLFNICDGPSGCKLGFIELRELTDILNGHSDAANDSAVSSSIPMDMSGKKDLESDTVDSEGSTSAERAPPKQRKKKVRISSPTLADDRPKPAVNKSGFDKNKAVRVIVAGGDGTVMWCVSEMRKHSVNLDFVTVGVLPFGTGNDFARALAWNETVFTSSQSIPQIRAVLKHLITEWMVAEVARHDLWNVEFETRQTGLFKRIDGATRRKRILMNDTNTGPTNKANFKLSNYFSIGVESRIGVGFDRYRTKSAFFNRLRYATEGLKKYAFKHTRKINEVVDYMTAVRGRDHYEVFHCPPQPANVICSLVERAKTFDPEGFKRLPTGKLQSSKSVGFMAKRWTTSSNSSTLPGEEQVDFIDSDEDEYLYSLASVKSFSQIAPSARAPSGNFCRSIGINPTRNSPLLLNAATLIGINIPSFAAGLDVWKGSRQPGYLGANNRQVRQIATLPLFIVTKHDITYGKTVHKEQITLSEHQDDEEFLRAEQKMGDGCLEFVTFSSVASMGLERFIRGSGHGKRLCNGTGPFTVCFKPLPRDWRVYFQVDGEFFQVTKPKRTVKEFLLQVLCVPAVGLRTAKYRFARIANAKNIQKLHIEKLHTETASTVVWEAKSGIIFALTDKAEDVSTNRSKTREFYETREVFGTEDLIRDPFNCSSEANWFPKPWRNCTP